jgi:hypothetical protein
MSAFVSDDQTINRIVSGLCFAKLHGDYSNPIPRLDGDLAAAIESPAEFGRTLYAMNVNAVEQRYPDCIGNPNNLPGQCDDDGNHLPYQYQSIIPPQPIQLYKSIQSYLYQCNEGDVDEFPLYKTLNGYLVKLACHIVDNSPAYDKADWG